MSEAPERDLWRAVLLRALNDALGEFNDIRDYTSGKRASIINEAKSYLSGGRDLRSVCDFAEVQYEKFLENSRKILEGGLDKHLEMCYCNNRESSHLEKPAMSYPPNPYMGMIVRYNGNTAHPLLITRVADFVVEGVIFFRNGTTAPVSGVQPAPVDDQFAHGTWAPLQTQ